MQNHLTPGNTQDVWVTVRDRITSPFIVGIKYGDDIKFINGEVLLGRKF